MVFFHTKPCCKYIMVFFHTRKTTLSVSIEENIALQIADHKFKTELKVKTCKTIKIEG